MTQIATTKLSSKGQIVLPAEIREGMKEGENFIIVKDDDRIVLKKVAKLSEQMKEDLEFARRTERAIRRLKDGQGIRRDFEDFIDEMKKW